MAELGKMRKEEKIMENKSIFDLYPETHFKIGCRGFGKLYEIQKTLTVLMTKYAFSVGRFKATTVIKLEKFDDIYILYGNELKCIESKKGFELVGKTSLYSIAQFYQSIFINMGNGIFGGFNHGI